MKYVKDQSSPKSDDLPASLPGVRAEPPPRAARTVREANTSDHPL